MNKLYDLFCRWLLCKKENQNPPFWLATFIEISVYGEFFYGMNTESSTQKQTLSFD